MDPSRVYWQRARPPPRPALTGTYACDVAVIGGGMAGLEAAKLLVEAGKRVALLEADVCGGAATGCSSGFMTADSELQVAQLLRRFGEYTTRALYEAVHAVTTALRDEIERDAIACDLIEADCLFVARDPRSYDDIVEEHRARWRLGMESSLLVGDELHASLGPTSRYFAGVRYSDTYALDAFAFAQARAKNLEAKGLRIFEATRVVAIEPGVVRSEGGEVRCDKVVVATDRFTPELGIERPDVYAVQTVLALSKPMPKERLDALFPTGPLMVWDSELDYRYFRPTPEGRLLFGGNQLRRVYLSSTDESEPVVPKLLDDVRKHLPGLGEVEIEWHWPGYLGVSRDLLPIAGRLDDWRAVAICGTGIPWSAFGGQIAARAVLGESEPLDTLFHPHRTFTELELFQPVLSKPLTFALSHLHAKRWLTGTSEEVKFRKQVLGVTVAAAVVGGVLWWLLRDDDEKKD